MSTVAQRRTREAVRIHPAIRLTSSQGIRTTARARTPNNQERRRWRDLPRERSQTQGKLALITKVAVPPARRHGRWRLQDRWHRDGRLGFWHSAAEERSR